MSAISAIYSFTKIVEENIQQIEKMNKAMIYRGPDGQKIWNNDKVVLSQIDLCLKGKSYEKVFSFEDRLYLVADATISNYNELKLSLQSKGYSFESDDSSEVILYLYNEYAEKCVEKLDGAFAFVIYDKNKNQIFAVRDRVGVKTLYYTHTNTAYIFSTELKTISSIFNRNNLNLKELLTPIRFTAPLTEKETFIEEINRLEPAHYITINENGIKNINYWKRKRTETFKGNKKEAQAELLKLLEIQVSKAMDSDQPVAFMLSGGVDSSAMAALAKRTGKEVHTITAGYKGQFSCDERDVAKRFAQEQGFIHHEIELDESDFINCFNEFTQYIDEPITDSAAVAQWALFKKVNELGFKVLIGGMGGDEIFYGYPYWNKLSESLSLQNKFHTLHPIKRNKKEYLKFILKNYKWILRSGHPYKIADSSICWWMRDDYYKFATNFTIKYPQQQSEIDPYSINFFYPPCELGAEIDNVYQICYKNIMIKAYLYLSDREAAANGIEVRSPIIDHTVIDFIDSLPLSMKYTSDRPKLFFKETLAGIVPDYILYANKRGFTPPNKFIDDIVSQYNYKYFNSNFKFYNSVLADRVASLIIKK